MDQELKKSTATIVAFLVTPLAPIIAMPLLHGLLDGAGLSAFLKNEEIGILYIASFMYFLVFALPAYMTLLFLQGEVKMWGAIIVGLIGGFFAAEILVAAEVQTSQTEGCIAGVITAIVFWLILKAGKVNINR